MGLATDVENMLQDPISEDSNAVFNIVSITTGMVGYSMAQMAAKKAYTQAGDSHSMIWLLAISVRTGIKATDAQVVELHDCFSTNELLTYEALVRCYIYHTHNKTYPV